ncbi:helix-turn-helix transcriptional regulator [Nocardioides sp. NPDC057764]|uniref:helix-turn-helix transcriptional regulator n=1 Tax=Nocardioides sp. NPDC057764 TaxID=3346243 RepID=UPI00366F3504
MIRYLSLSEVADLLGLQTNTLKRYSHEGRLPPPDATIGTRRGWLEETIQEWHRHRPGAGARTDLDPDSERSIGQN